MSEKQKISEEMQIPTGPLASQDLLPIPKANRKWGMYTVSVLAFGLITVLSQMWYAPGNILVYGLSAIESLLAIAAGLGICAVFYVMNGDAGVKYGLGTSTTLRAAFGYRGVHVSSAITAFALNFWIGINSWVASLGTDLILQNHFPMWANVPGHMPIIFAIVYLLSFILTSRMKAVASFLKIVAPIMILMFAIILAWAFSVTGSVGPSWNLQLTPWSGNFGMFMAGVTASIAWTTPAMLWCNYARFFSSSKAHVGGVFGPIGIIGAGLISSIVGIGLMSMAMQMGLGPLWNVIDFVAAVPNPWIGGLAIIFVILAAMSTSVVCAGASAASIMNISPKRISFRIAVVIAFIIGIAVQPWNYVASAYAFIDFVVKYTGFLLAPILAIMVCDYWFIRRRKLKVLELYNPEGIYKYSGKINPIAIVTLAISIAVGLVAVYTGAGMWLWFVTFPVGVVVYYGLMKSIGAAKYPKALAN